MAAPQPPSSQHLQLLKPGFLLNVNNYNYDPATKDAIDRYGGLEKYKADVDAYNKAYDRYRVAFSEHLYNQAATGEIPGASMSAYQSGLATTYRNYADKVDDQATKDAFLERADELEGAATTSKNAEDRSKYLRDAANPIRDQLRTDNLSIRDAEFGRLIEQRDAAYGQVDTAYNRDMDRLQNLKASGLISAGQYENIRDKIASDRKVARDAVSYLYTTGRSAATDRYNQGKDFYAETYNQILGGEYQEGRQYALPTYDKEPIQISSSYKPYFTDVTDDSKPTQAAAPSQQPRQNQPTSIQSKTLQKVPNTVGGSGQSSGSTPTGGASVVGGQGSMLDASNLQQSPGLISGADRLTYTPAANLSVGGLIATQNPQIYNYGGPRVRLPGSV